MVVVVLIVIIGLIFIMLSVTNQNEKNKRQEYNDNLTSLMKTAPAAFNSTKTITISDDLVFLIDNNDKKVCILRPNFQKIFNYDQIIDIEYIVNEETIASKSNLNTIGRAIVGGAVAGGVGAIVGGLSGKTKSVNLISKISVKLLFQDLDFPALSIKYFDCESIIGGKPVPPDEPLCMNAVNKAQDFVNIMSVIIDEGKKMAIPKVQDQPLIEKQPNFSVADELKKLAALRDEGILTQEEFEKQKSSLLS